MSQEHYLPSKSRDDVERERLGLLETCNDPFTVSRLEALGVKEGWNCLEVGAGRGSIAMWLTSRVGHSGKIVATDVDMRYLQNLSIPNLEVRKHDITKDELEEGQYDLVHCRALLLHLREPEKALERMAKAIRRGGWIFVEESDWGLFGAIDPDHPSAALFNQVHQAGLDLVQRMGIMNPYFGRRVRSLVENLGFTEVGHEGLARVGRGGEPWARMQAMTGELLVPFMINAGLLTQEQFEVLGPSWQDPRFYFLGTVMFRAWGKRP